MKIQTYSKRYNSLDLYYKNKYGQKVAKVSLNANFSCPNKDGTKGYGGCTYCSKLGSGDFAGDVNLSFKDQYNQIKAMILNKWSNALLIPYLQANTNTYAPLDQLKRIYEEVIAVDPHMIGLAIATRPDCLDDEIIKYLGELNQRIPLSIELGLQTSNETTANYINRCATNQEFIDAVVRLRSQNIEVVVHIMNGLPNETQEDMLNTIHFINSLDIQGVKIHSLLILKNTKIHLQYLNNEFKLLSLEDYIQITSKQIALLHPDIIIHRLAADANLEDLVEPLWTRKKLVVMNEIDKYLKQHQIIQGIHYKKNPQN